VDAHLHALGPAAVLRTSVASGHRCVRCVRGESHDRLAVPTEREVWAMRDSVTRLRTLERPEDPAV
jgi:hypothetical protein